MQEFAFGARAPRAFLASPLATRYWSRVKWYARQHSDGSKEGLKARADEALGDKGCDLALIRRYARTSWRWVDAYCSGLDGVLACWAVRKSKAHRCVTGAADREVNKIKEEKDRTAGVRASAKAAAAGDAPPVVLLAVAAMVAVGARVMTTMTDWRGAGRRFWFYCYLWCPVAGAICGQWLCSVLWV